jgi:hypothetical protein
MDQVWRINKLKGCFRIFKGLVRKSRRKERRRRKKWSLVFCNTRCNLITKKMPKRLKSRHKRRLSVVEWLPLTAQKTQRLCIHQQRFWYLTFIKIQNHPRVNLILKKKSIVKKPKSSCKRVYLILFFREIKLFIYSKKIKRPKHSWVKDNLFFFI